MLKDYFLLAFSNLKSKGLRSWLTILGIIIGIAAVVSLITMGQGLETAITGQLGTLSVDTLTIQNKGVGFAPPGSTVVKKLDEHDLDVIKSVRGIDKVAPRLLRVGKLEYNKVAGFGYAIDLPEDRELIDFVYSSFNLKAEEGSLLQLGDRGKILLGNDFLTTENFGREFHAGRSVLINDKKFEIAGMLEKSDSFQINSLVIMMHDDMKELFGTDDTYDLIVVQVQDKNQIEDVASEIERKLRGDRHEKGGEETFTVETPIQSLQSVNTILNIINLIVIGIAAISLFVGGVGIANTMYTSVVERTREIGIMKAVGAQNSDVLWIFLIESGLLGLGGGIAGALMGLGGAMGISMVANQALGGDLFMVAISYPLLFGAIGFSFVVGVISGILPALQASKLNVVDALRE